MYYGHRNPFIATMVQLLVAYKPVQVTLSVDGQTTDGSSKPE
jgi:hypothetical protein